VAGHDGDDGEEGLGPTGQCALSRYDLGGVTARGGVVVAGTDQLRLPVVKVLPDGTFPRGATLCDDPILRGGSGATAASVAATKRYPWSEP
jgi:hypothetical protein